ncbi:ATP-binding protein [Streptomyces sp. NPDC003011]
MRTADIAAALGVARINPIRDKIAFKLGVKGRSRRMAGFVFRARVHALLDRPDPADPGLLPPDVFGFVRALALGLTLKEHAADLGVPVYQVDHIARETRARLQGETQPNLVYRALPQLLSRLESAPSAAAEVVQGPPYAPNVGSLATQLPPDPSAHRMVRIWIRVAVTALRWRGDVDRAVQVASRLVDNGVRHGVAEHVSGNSRWLTVRAAVSEAQELVLDVTDSNAAFPDAAPAPRGERGRGLAQVVAQGATVSWFMPHEAPGKTVRAVLPREAAML